MRVLAGKHIRPLHHYLVQGPDAVNCVQLVLLFNWYCLVQLVLLGKC